MMAVDYEHENAAMLAELGIRAYRHWFLGADWQWTLVCPLPWERVA